MGRRLWGTQDLCNLHLGSLAHRAVVVSQGVYPFLPRGRGWWLLAEGREQGRPKESTREGNEVTTGMQPRDTGNREGANDSREVSESLEKKPASPNYRYPQSTGTSMATCQASGRACDEGRGTSG